MNEQIIWAGQTSRTIIVVRTILSLVLFIIISAFLFTKQSIDYTNNGTVSTISGSLVGTITLILGLAVAIGSFLSSFVRKYTITDKAVKVRSGILVTNERILYYDQIRNASLQRGLLDMLVGTGTILIDTGLVETTVSTVNDQPISSTQTAFNKFISIGNYQSAFDQLQATLQQNKANLYAGKSANTATPSPPPPPIG